ncbi:hypothetical protein T07_1636 [Trichinella nelsoni]|uniref:Uncharacterized protein n=1 Tax=Trichinella nelsoni TaxID=6336 RepID=A0A0V0RQC5_9BILA|nr:hypothetical protein T07_1636 [Trichinella nelsoni]
MRSLFKFYTELNCVTLGILCIFYSPNLNTNSYKQIQCTRLPQITKKALQKKANNRQDDNKQETLFRGFAK